MRRAARKLSEVAVTLLVASFLVFMGMHAAPGSPVATLVGGPENVTEANIEAIEERYHLDEPVIVQYGQWLGQVVQGDLGRSYVYGDQVMDLLLSRLSVTLSLVSYATVLFLVLGIGLGVLAALRRGVVDVGATALTTVFSSTPGFVVGIALIAIFGVQLGVFPVTGAGSGLADRIYHLTLPAVALTLVSVALIARITRQSMVDGLDRDHVEVARSRGLRERTVVVRHVLRNAWGPILTMSGIVVASMLAGTVVIETVFGLSGIGSLLVDSINTSDFPVTQAVLLFMVLAYVAVTTVTDLVYPLIDPRVRPGGRS